MKTQGPAHGNLCRKKSNSSMPSITEFLIKEGNIPQESAKLENAF